MSTQASPDGGGSGSSGGEIAAQRYLMVEQSGDFARLRRTLRSFVFPMTVAFLAWYLLYVLLAAYARDFMSIKLVGNINVAFVFGLLQFVSTFGIAWWYSRFASTRIDPLADRIRAEAEGTGTTEGGAR